MYFKRFASACIGAALGVAAYGSAASAADLSVYKAPPPPPFELDVHGFADFEVVNGRVTPGGLRIYPNRGYLTHVSSGLSLDVYKDKNGFINKISFFGGIWNEVWSDPPIGGSAWQEMDWWVGASIGFAKYWTFTVQHLQFMFPGGATDYNYTFTLGFDDSFTGWPVTFNPYVNVFNNASGPSTVVLGDNGRTYRVEIGMTPTVPLKKATGIPLTIAFPTWVTIGPSSYWNRNDGTTNLCGTTGTSPCALSNAGLFSTGLQARLSLEDVVPKRLGSWYVKGGVQYYRILNDALLAAQVVTGAAATFNDAESDVFIGNVGVGFTF
jgi:hypothetical protein